MTENNLDVLNDEMILEMSKFMLPTKTMNIADIDMDHANMCIEIRPPYCDRGRYSVKCWHKKESFMSCWIDEQDAFPRYYFDFFSMMTEITAFIAFRKLNVLSVRMSNTND